MKNEMRQSSFAERGELVESLGSSETPHAM
jgi:hypothetical protein